MQIDTLPVHAPVTDPATGEERRIAAALLLMNDPADDGRTTGWYWSEVPRNPETGDLKSRGRWSAAVANQQGPFRDANAALAAAENHTREGAALAARLEQAAELLRGGEIEATPAAIAAWLGEAGAATPVGRDPDGKQGTENPEEVRTMLDGEVLDANPDDADAGDTQLEVHENSSRRASSS